LVVGADAIWLTELRILFKQDECSKLHIGYREYADVIEDVAAFLSRLFNLSSSKRGDLASHWILE
jgi:hypothetical protein